jgi:hypothetical protein
MPSDLLHAMSSQPIGPTTRPSTAPSPARPLGLPIIQPTRAQIGNPISSISISISCFLSAVLACRDFSSLGTQFPGGRLLYAPFIR